MTKEEKDKIVKVLEERLANSPCPRCAFNEFGLVDGYFVTSLQENTQGFVIGGRSIPSVAVVCKRCGYISNHALGVLGLLPKTEEDIPGNHKNDKAPEQTV